MLHLISPILSLIQTIVQLLRIMTLMVAQSFNNQIRSQKDLKL